MNGGLRHRFALMLGGEAVQSAFHFGLNVVLVHTLTQADYGLFAIVFLLGGIGLTYVRALAGVPASTFIPRRPGHRSARAYEVTFGSGAVVVSVLFGLGVTALLLLWPGVNAAEGGAFVSLWCLRSYLRLALFAKRRPREAGIGDVTFAVAGTGLALALIHGSDIGRIDGVFLALAGAHALGGAASLLALREPVRLSFGAATRRRYTTLREKLAWSFLGVTTTTLQGQGQTLLVALVAGPQAYAPIAASLVLFSPLRLAVGAMLNMVQPEIAAAIAAGDPAHRIRMVRRTGLLISAASAAYGAALLLAWPLVRFHLFGGRFDGEPLGLITGLLWVVSAVSLGYGAPRILLEVVGEYRFLAFVSAAAAAVGALAVALLLVVATPAWSILGLLSSELIVLVACSRHAGRSTPPRQRARPLASRARAAWPPHSKDAPCL